MTRREKILLALVAVALPIALSLAQGAEENRFGNMGYFHVAQAHQVVLGRGFGHFFQGEFLPDLFCRPTYTLFVAPVVALLDWKVEAIRSVVAALQGGLLFVAALAAAGCVARAGAPRAARVAAWLVVLNPVLVSQAATLVDTTLFTTATLGAYACVVATPADAPRRRFLLAGLVLGFALLTRSTAVAVAPAILLTLRRKLPTWSARLAAAGLVAVGACAVLAPWLVRNHALTDRWMLSTVDGVNLWMGNNENTSQFLDRRQSLDELPGRLQYDCSLMAPVATQLAKYDAARAAAGEFIRTHPGETATLALRKAGDLWSIVPTPRSTRAVSVDLKEMVSIAWTVPLFAFAALGLFVGLRTGGATKSLAVDVLVTAFVFTLPHALAWGGTRLRAPLDPFLAMIAAVGLVAAYDRARRRPT